MRRVVPCSLLFLTLAGCSGAFDDECDGDHQVSQLLEGPTGDRCTIVEIAEGSDGSVAIEDACPVGRCVVLMSGENFRIWKDTLDPDPVYREATLGLQFGECPLSCD